MRQLRFQNCVVLITGATSGIGRATALAFAREGARVGLLARDVTRLEQVAKTCGELQSNPNAALALPADITDAASLQTAVASAVRQWGRVDIFINNAGIGHNVTLSELGAARANQIVATNLTGTLNGIFAVLPQMKSQTPIRIGRHTLRGQIINVSSILAYKGVPRVGLYSAAKAAQRILSESLRHELRHEKIGVVTICPGSTETELFQRAITDGSPWIVKHRWVMSAEKAADAIVRASYANKREIVLTLRGKAMMWATRYCPGVADWAVGKIYDNYLSQQKDIAPRNHTSH